MPVGSGQRAVGGKVKEMVVAEWTSGEPGHGTDPFAKKFQAPFSLRPQGRRRQRWQVKSRPPGVAQSSFRS